jgi:hypothetical protein
MGAGAGQQLRGMSGARAAADGWVRGGAPVWRVACARVVLWGGSLACKGWIGGPKRAKHCTRE